MKKWVQLIVTAMCLIALAACAGQGDGDIRSDIRSQIAGKSFVYEKDGFGSDFTIEIKDDNTYSYYEGVLSSIIGGGKWELDGSVLCLLGEGESDRPIQNYFKVDGSDLVFRAEKSSNFVYIDVSDGERFHKKQH